MQDFALNQSKRDHTVVWPDYFSKGENLEAWQLGWLLYMVPCDQKVWDVVCIEGSPLEEVLQSSYIVNIS